MTKDLQANNKELRTFLDGSPTAAIGKRHAAVRLYRTGIFSHMNVIGFEPSVE